MPEEKKHTDKYADMIIAIRRTSRPTGDEVGVILPNGTLNAKWNVHCRRKIFSLGVIC